MAAIRNVIRGDSHTILLAITNKNREPVDLTDYTIFFTVNASNNPLNDSAAVIQKTVPIDLPSSPTDTNDPVNGKMEIPLDPIDTMELSIQRYYYDIQLKDAENNITSIPQDTFEVVADITRRI